MHLKTIIAMILLAFGAGAPRTQDVPAGSRASGPLTLTTSSTPSAVARGGTIAFAITVANVSASPVAEVTLCDVLPPSVAAVVQAGGTRLFDDRACRTLAEVPAEASVTVRLVVRIARRARLGAARNAATAFWAGTRLTARAGFRIGSARPLCPFG